MSPYASDDPGDGMHRSKHPGRHVLSSGGLQSTENCDLIEAKYAMGKLMMDDPSKAAMEKLIDPLRIDPPQSSAVGLNALTVYLQREET